MAGPGGHRGGTGGGIADEWPAGGDSKTPSEVFRSSICLHVLFIMRFSLVKTVNPPSPEQNRWDVELLAESAHFVALTKPAGMFVVTDERGLWEESATNFIHVAHRRSGRGAVTGGV